MERKEFITSELKNIPHINYNTKYDYFYHFANAEVFEKAKRELGIDPSESILYILMYQPFNFTTIFHTTVPPTTVPDKFFFAITDRGIYKKEKVTVKHPIVNILSSFININIPENYPWESISEVRFIHGGIKIYYHNSQLETIILDPKNKLLLKDLPVYCIASTLNKIAQYKDHNSLDYLDQLVNNKQYTDFLIESEKFLANEKLLHFPIRKNRIQLLIKEDSKRAYQETREMFLNFKEDIFREDQNFEALETLITQFEGLCEQYGHGKVETLPYWTLCRDLTPNEMLRQEFQKKVEAWYSLNVNKFLDIPYHRRKFLAIDSKLSIFPESLHVLKRDELPEGICFTHGHPIECGLYICHPYKHDLYIPYESCEFELFKDKISEYCEVLECLGAKEVRIEDSLNNETTTKTNRNLDINAEADAKFKSGSASIKRSSNDDRYENLKRKLGRYQEYKPMSKPYIPQKVVWYPHETEWQRLSAQRQRGSIIKHQEFLSISTELQTNKNELTSIKAEFKALILKTKGNVNYEIDSIFENKTTSEWKVSIVFYPLSELPDVISSTKAQKVSFQIENTNAKNEKEYRDEVQFHFNNGSVIDNKERVILSRLQAKLDISDVQAKRIENEVVSGGGLSKAEQDYTELSKAEQDYTELSKAEQDYTEVYKEFLEDDGVIDEKERQLLVREQSKLVLSKERVVELESNIKGRLHTPAHSFGSSFLEYFSVFMRWIASYMTNKNRKNQTSSN